MKADFETQNRILVRLKKNIRKFEYQQESNKEHEIDHMMRYVEKRSDEAGVRKAFIS